MTWLKVAYFLLVASLVILVSGFAAASASRTAAEVLFWVTAGVAVSGMVCAAVSFRFTR